MNVKIYSRKSIEQLMANGQFPENTAVISFYDPVLRHIDKDYQPVDYSEVCKNIFQSELCDIDLSDLEDEGKTYDDLFL